MISDGHDFEQQFVEPTMMVIRPKRTLVAGAGSAAVNHNLVVGDEELYGDCVNRLLHWRSIAPAGRMTKRLDG